MRPCCVDPRGVQRETFSLLLGLDLLWRVGLRVQECCLHAVAIPHEAQPENEQRGPEGREHGDDVRVLNGGSGGNPCGCAVAARAEDACHVCKLGALRFNHGHLNGSAVMHLEGGAHHLVGVGKGGFDLLPRVLVRAVVIAGVRGEAVRVAAVRATELGRVPAGVLVGSVVVPLVVAAEALHHPDGALAFGHEAVGRVEGARGRTDAVGGGVAADALLEPIVALGAARAHTRHSEVHLRRALACRAGRHLPPLGLGLGHGLFAIVFIHLDVAELPAHIGVHGVAPRPVLPIRVATVVVAAQACPRVEAHAAGVLVRVLRRPRLAGKARLGLVHVAAIVGAIGLEVALVVAEEAVSPVVFALGHVALRVALAIVLPGWQAASRAAHRLRFFPIVPVVREAVAAVPVAQVQVAGLIADTIADPRLRAAACAVFLLHEAVPAIVEAGGGVALLVAHVVGQVEVGATGGALDVRRVFDGRVREIGHGEEELARGEAEEANVELALGGGRVALEVG
mmetsp:Transcript_6878/g.18644  ORF Transcript_6878/g.18644 Transcript_6878/m.18644 type:complete len:511 (-) Transcript_6878:400-1932(-)